MLFSKFEKAGAVLTQQSAQLGWGCSSRGMEPLSAKPLQGCLQTSSVWDLPAHAVLAHAHQVISSHARSCVREPSCWVCFQAHGAQHSVCRKGTAQQAQTHLTLLDKIGTSLAGLAAGSTERPYLPPVASGLQEVLASLIQAAPEGVRASFIANLQVHDVSYTCRNGQGHVQCTACSRVSLWRPHLSPSQALGPLAGRYGADAPAPASQRSSGGLQGEGAVSGSHCRERARDLRVL